MFPQVPRLQKPGGNCWILLTHPAPEFNLIANLQEGSASKVAAQFRNP